MCLINKMYNLCEKIVEKKPENFSGLGLVVYDTNQFDDSLHCDLRPNSDYIHYTIEDEELVDYLINVSDYHNTLHDGFHMLNENGILTHVAQYFVPPIIKEISPDQDHGVRVYSSLCGSTIKGVLFIVAVCSDLSIYIMKDGKVFSKKEGKLYV